MYAIVETGGKQYRVKPGDTVAVERLSGEPGETLDLDRVLLIAGNGNDEARIGSPGVAGAIVRAEVVDHFRGEKIIIFRYKSKVRYRRKTGHRQSLTRLRITDILVDGASSVAREQAEQVKASAAATATPAATTATPAAAAASVQPSADVSTAATPTRPSPAEETTSAAPSAPAETPMPASAGEAGPAPDAADDEQAEAPKSGA
ncbi:MAG TPA: 50S ribosomal protein L21 [Chloroflexota bacterium]|jgi:large subunit ribosomal protein L21